MPHARRALFTAKLDALEIARGHDGLMRGHPEPVVVIGAGVVRSDGPLLASRHIARFGTLHAVPATILPREAVRLTADHTGARGSFFLFAVALEQDDGTDVAALYGALESPKRWAVWHDDASTFEPLDVSEAAHRFAEAPAAVQPMLDGMHVRLGRDDLVGAAFLGAPTHVSRRGLVRMHLVSKDGENDWTARFVVTVRGNR